MWSILKGASFNITGFFSFFLLKISKEYKRTFFRGMTLHMNIQQCAKTLQKKEPWSLLSPK